MRAHNSPRHSTALLVIKEWKSPGSAWTKARVYPSPQMPPRLRTPVITDRRTLFLTNAAVASVRQSMKRVTSCDITARHASSALSVGLGKDNSMHFQINSMGTLT